ncbi:FAD-binding monooxygenase [Spirosoma sp. HMF3257]|uniref:FAD-binding monooxygenase n=2 Tax=Spirosoma telluris TaxID=2183553 RepID=A0A327NT48_9BACT|nr:FAD-binding monooxygenase [Spirosoma telluris]RAI76984.1 FAD-binding monooxygenase [Spirosoma telluris]
MSMTKSVLISGASIAGLTMAYWMRQYGYKVTVIEIGPAPRMGGSPIDVRGDSLDTARRMGVLDAIKAAKLQTKGLEFMNADGEVEGMMRVEEIGAIRPGDDTEIRRDDLVNILYGNAKDGISYRFNNRIIALTQSEDQVSVTLSDGSINLYDFVIGADGIHSGVRKLVFGPEEQFSHFLNFYFSVFPVDVRLGKKNYGQMYTTPTNLVMVYLYNEDCADGFLAFRVNEKINYNRNDIEAQKRIVIEAFKDIGWKVPQLIDELKNADAFYFDQGCQIKMPTWTNGRVALIGDAGYAPAFPTGMGSTLAIQGATVLADAMAEVADYKVAFQKYNETFRPTVDALQATVYDGLSFLLPETQEAINIRNKGSR